MDSDEDSEDEEEADKESSANAEAGSQESAAMAAKAKTNSKGTPKYNSLFPAFATVADDPARMLRDKTKTESD